MKAAGERKLFWNPLSFIGLWRIVLGYFPQYILAHTPCLGRWVERVLFRKFRQFGVDIGFIPIETRTEFNRFGQTTRFNVAVDCRAATSAEFGLKLCEGKVSHHCAPLIDMETH